MYTFRTRQGMQEVYLTGDVRHELAKAVQKAVRGSDAYLLTKSTWRHDVVIDFNLTYNGASVAAIMRTRARTLAALQRLITNPAGSHVRYIHVVCDGSTHDAQLVKQFQRDYGVHACVVDLGVLLGPHTPSKIKDIHAGIGGSDGIIRFVDEPAPVRSTGVYNAVQAILFVLDHGATFAGTLSTQNKDVPVARLSVYADKLSVAARQPRRHFMFLETPAHSETLLKV